MRSRPTTYSPEYAAARDASIGQQAAAAINETRDTLVNLGIHVRELRGRRDRGVATEAELRELDKAELKFARMQGEVDEARRVLEVTGSMVGG